VTEYAFELYLQGAQAPFYTMSLGKPAPQGDGKIRYDFSANVTAWPLPGGTYEARVAALGPTGTGRSAASNTFQFASCAYTLGPSAATVGAPSGSSSFIVTTTAGCAWTVTSSAAWVSLITSTGTGSGTVSFSYQANGVGASRAATLSVSGTPFALTQSAASCSYTVSPGSFALPAAASGSTAIAVTATSGCAWTAATTAPWITLGNKTGTGNGSATFMVAANPDGLARTGTISIGSHTISVAQAAAACGVTVTPTSLTLGSQAGTVAIGITTPTGCPWTATSSVAWASLATTSGTGTTSVALTYQAHTGTTARTGAITVGGVTIPLTQQIYRAPVAPSNLRVVPSSN
jgi:hypothetical protein